MLWLDVWKGLCIEKGLEVLQVKPLSLFFEPSLHPTPITAVKYYLKGT